MKKRVTVVCDDKAVYIGSGSNVEVFTSLNVQFPDGVHAIQWRNGAGEIEWKDKNIFNTRISGLDDYNQWILPFVEAVESKA